MPLPAGGLKLNSKDRSSGWAGAVVAAALSAVQGGNQGHGFNTKTRSFEDDTKNFTACWHRALRGGVRASPHPYTGLRRACQQTQAVRINALFFVRLRYSVASCW